LDGSNIWVCNAETKYVTELSDGTFVASYKSGGKGSSGIVFDGTSIWVSNEDGGSVSKITLDNP
jgi:hypothetical protein